MKKIISLILVLFTVLSLFACADKEGNGDTTTKKDETNKKEDTTVTTTLPDFVPSSPFAYENQMSPIWTGTVSYDEPLMFVEGLENGKLLYDATKIISVRSSDLKTTYTEGVDYKLENGAIKLLPGSKIPCMSLSEYFPATGSGKIYTLHNGVYKDTWRDSHIANRQVVVTYEHAEDEIIEIPNCSEDFKNVVKKLKNGEDVTFIFYGDSITEGWDNSRKWGEEPFMPPWTVMFTQSIAYQYGYKINYVRTGLQSCWNYPANYETYGDRGTINYINLGVGGWTLEDSYNKISSHVKPMVNKYGCDLFTYAFGMNNVWDQPEVFNQKAIKALKEIVKTIPKDTVLTLVSSMLHNYDDQFFSNRSVHMFQSELYKIEKVLDADGATTVVSPTTTPWQLLRYKKNFRDVSGNNMNHPGDYGHRIYAQVLFQTLTGYAD